jgi:hypothetical protein
MALRQLRAVKTGAEAIPSRHVASRHGLGYALLDLGMS